VLEDGTRVFSGRGMQKAIGSSSTSGTWLKKYINSSPITPFLEIGIIEKFNNPIRFHRPAAGGSQSMTYEYEVTILIDVCEAIIKANENRQNVPENIVKSAKVILIAVAKVGIIALVDEATGYQYDRERQELQAILKLYISEELLLWEKKFPDVFYQQIFKLNGWDFTVNGIKKRPGVIGTWTNNLIYKQLPKGVLDELKKRTPKNEKGKRKHRFHQLLTLNVGHPDLQKQLSSVITIMKLSKDWEHFLDQFNQIYGQTKLDLKFDKIDKKKDKPVDETLSNFNQNLTKALNHNPRNQDDKK